MAIESPVQYIPGAQAGLDFSGASGGAGAEGYQGTGQFLIVTNAGQPALTFVPVSAPTQLPSGISQTNPAEGDELGVMNAGISKVVIGPGGLVNGEEYGPNQYGQAIALVTHATGANIGDFSCGEVLQGGNAGELATVTFYKPSRII